MKQLRWRMSLLILWLALVFNVERLDFDHGSPVNLASFFYVVIAGTAALFLFAPFSRRQMYLAVPGVLGLYGVLKVISDTPLFSGAHKFLTVTEVVGLLVTIGLARLVSLGLFDFEQAVEAISLPKGRPQLLAYADVSERIHAEMSRARRHQHPISVAMIELDSRTFKAALHQAVRDAQAAMISRYVQVRFGLFLTKNVRGTDAIAHYNERGRFLLVTPESPAAQTEAMLARLARQVEEQMGIRFRYSIADFPSGALTSEELLRKVAEDLEREPATPAVSAPPVAPKDGPRLEPMKMYGPADGYPAVPVARENGNGNGRDEH